MMGTGTVAAQPGDFVVGAGRFDDILGGVKVEITARSDADGANASGRFSLRRKGVKVIGEVTCLAVNGAVAAAGGVIVETTFSPPNVGDTFFQIVRDNGQGQDDNDESQTLFGGDPDLCADHLDFDPGATMDRGNYDVEDR